jgi:hypothetical protein
MNKKEFFLISLTVFLIVLAWLVADIYHVSQQEKIQTPQLPIIKNYNLDNGILDQLSKKNP